MASAKAKFVSAILLLKWRLKLARFRNWRKIRCLVASEFQEVAGYNAENFGDAVGAFGTLLEPQAIADAIYWLLSLPPHVNVNEIMVRPTGQSYP